MTVRLMAPKTSKATSAPSGTLPQLKYKAALSAAFGAGLRAAVVISLEIGDIDSKRSPRCAINGAKARRCRSLVFVRWVRARQTRLRAECCREAGDWCSNAAAWNRIDPRTLCLQRIFERLHF